METKNGSPQILGQQSRSMTPRIAYCVCGLMIVVPLLLAALLGASSLWIFVAAMGGATAAGPLIVIAYILLPAVEPRTEDPAVH